MPMSGAPPIETPAEYLEKMRRLLGDRDPLEVLSATPALLVGIVRSNTVAQLKARPFEGKWTPNEILGHLVDIEWVFAFRVRRVLCDVDPAIEGFDQSRWVDRQGHNDGEPTDHLDAFSLLRSHNMALWRKVTPDDLNRTYHHQERGTETIATMRVLHAGHDLAHLDQLSRYLADIKSSS